MRFLSLTAQLPSAIARIKKAGGLEMDLHLTRGARVEILNDQSHITTIMVLVTVV